MKEQWFRIVTGFAISIMRIKLVKFRDHTVEARELVDVIWSKKLEHLRAISVFGASFLLLLGPPFTTWYNDLTFSETQKSALGAASNLGRQMGYPKSETAVMGNF